MKDEEIKKLESAIKWARTEHRRRVQEDDRHPSFLVSAILEEAEKKFELGSYGVDGWSAGPTGRNGVQYLNYGDPYKPTIVVRSNPIRASYHLAIGGWAPYTRGEGT